MDSVVRSPRVVRFGAHEVDLQAGELRKNGRKLKLSGQPIQVLAILLEHPGEVVTREELQKRLWPDTFVDVDHNLNTAVNKIREVLGDSAEHPGFVETLPRRGYRFIAPIEPVGMNDSRKSSADSRNSATKFRSRTLGYGALFLSLAFAGGAGFLIYRRLQFTPSPKPHPLTRITFDAGLQFSPTWSPDGRFIAYASDRGGKLDIWVQQVSGGDPVQVTHGSGNNWQPSWSPDGKHIAYRSEAGSGLFIIPALGGEGLERRITSFGYKPRWSPDGSQILFQTLIGLHTPGNTFYVVGLDGGQPREVLAEFLAQHKDLWPGAVIWHPDGKSILTSVVEGGMYRSSPSLWTVPLSGGAGRSWKIPPYIAKVFDEVSGAQPIGEVGDPTFSWAPSGKAIYFSCEFQGAQNLWKMTVDPVELRATSVERLTAGPGPDTDPVVSPDGKKIAFVAKVSRLRVWVFSFDANARRISSRASDATSTGLQAFGPSLSRDGHKLAFTVHEGGRWQIWEKSLSGGREFPLITGDFDPDFPQWSPDGKKILHRRLRIRAGEPEGQLVVWSEEARTEEPLTTWTTWWGAPYDWSSDGQSVLVSSWKGNGVANLAQLPLDAAPHAETAARTIASKPGYGLWQPHISPNGRWIVFMEAQARPPSNGSTIYVMPANGGPWVRITEANHWTDKPRWSPDGKIIYYVVEKDGFLNVWGDHFDPLRGKPTGMPFQVTAFETPSLMFPESIEPADISVAAGKLAITLQESSGSIWMLDNVDQ